MRAVRYRDGIKEYIGQYPREDMDLVKGLEDGLEWKLIVEDDKPVFNTVFEHLKGTLVSTEDPHPDYSHLKIARVSWEVIRKPDTDIQTLIENYERQSNEKVFSPKNERKIIILALYALIRLAKGQSVPAKANTIADSIEVMALSIINNDNNLEAKLQQLANGETFDITDGYE